MLFLVYSKQYDICMYKFNFFQITATSTIYKPTNASRAIHNSDEMSSDKQKRYFELIETIAVINDNHISIPGTFS